MKAAFFWEGIKNFKLTGSLVPSSKFLVNRMVKVIREERPKCIVELGAGEGVITRKILEEMAKDSNLLTFELNPELYQGLMKQFKGYSNIKIINDDAKKINWYLSKNNYKQADCVISSLPLGNIRKVEIFKILHEIKKSLGENGKYIQYQYLRVDLGKVKRYFDVRLGFEIWNLPPAFIYTCKNKTLDFYR